MLESHNPTICIAYLQKTFKKISMLVWKPQSNHAHNLFPRNLNNFSPLVWKPKSSHPHSLFARNLNIFLLHLSLSDHWRLSKICSFVFRFVTIFQACVLSCHHSLSLCFVSLPPSELVFHHLITSWLCVSSPFSSIAIMFVVADGCWTSLEWSRNFSQRRKFIE
jgi:hypothetical protein